MGDLYISHRWSSLCLIELAVHYITGINSRGQYSYLQLLLLTVHYGAGLCYSFMVSFLFLCCFKTAQHSAVLCRRVSILQL